MSNFIIDVACYSGITRAVLSLNNTFRLYLILFIIKMVSCMLVA